MIIHVIVAGLAGWRLASLLVNEPGPWHVFSKLRAAAGLPDSGEIKDGFWPELFGCVWCMGVWTAAAAFLAWYVHPAIPGVMAAMAVVILVEALVRRNDR